MKLVHFIKSFCKEMDKFNAQHASAGLALQGDPKMTCCSGRVSTDLACLPQSRHPSAKNTTSKKLQKYYNCHFCSLPCTKRPTTTLSQLPAWCPKVVIYGCLRLTYLERVVFNFWMRFRNVLTRSHGFSVVAHSTDAPSLSNWPPKSDCCVNL